MQATPVALPLTVDTTGAKILEGDGTAGPDQRDSRDIWLPNWVETVSHIALDIGGSLAKVVYFTRTAKPTHSATSSYSNAEASPSSSTSSIPLAPLPHPSPPTSASLDSPPHTSLPSSFSSSRLHSRESSANAPPMTPTYRSRSPLNMVHSYPQTADGSAAVLGGTLTPTSLFTSQPPMSPTAIQSHLLTRRALPSQLPGGRLNFIKFETANIEDCVDFLRELISSSAKANNVSLAQMRQGVKLMATGGGAHLFKDMLEQELGVEVRREDEMGCLITGLNFITLIPDEAYYYSDELVASLHSSLPQEPSPTLDQLPRPSPDPPLYAPVFDSNPLPKLPCLLVNIGSGVSIIKVDDHGKFERVSGTSLGGGTLWGLLSLLTDADSFDEMLELASRGDNGTVDMLISDIYGSSDALTSLGLKSNTIASSFGKVFRKEDSREGDSLGGARERRKKKFRQEDICKSLLYAVSNNIGQIAYMNAEKFGLDRIYFGGCFIRGHQATIATLSYAIRFWSKGTKRAFFLRHEGYLGAIGCWIKQLSEPLPSSAAPAKEAKSKAKRHDEVNGRLPESKIPTPTGRETQSATTNGINPLLAEALGGASLADFSATTPAVTSTDTNVDGSASLDSLMVAPEDIDGVGEGKEELDELRGLVSSLNEEDKALLGPLVSSKENVSMADLLKQLDDASGAADGLESKLDSLLGRLDMLLEEEDR